MRLGGAAHTEAMILSSHIQRAAPCAHVTLNRALSREEILSNGTRQRSEQNRKGLALASVHYTKSIPLHSILKPLAEVKR